MISAYIFSLDRPVTLEWIERCAKESFPEADPDELVVYHDMLDIGFGPRVNNRANLGTKTVSLAEFRRFAKARRRGPERVTVEQALNHAHQ